MRIQKSKKQTNKQTKKTQISGSKPKTTNGIKDNCVKQRRMEGKL